MHASVLAVLFEPRDKELAVGWLSEAAVESNFHSARVVDHLRLPSRATDFLLLLRDSLLFGFLLSLLLFRSLLSLPFSLLLVLDSLLGHLDSIGLSLLNGRVDRSEVDFSSSLFLVAGAVVTGVSLSVLQEAQLDGHAGSN